MALMKSDNVRVLIQSTPQVWSENMLSHDKCVAAGESLLRRIESSGMTDELDQAAEAYIRKSRNTVKKMNDGRSPLTKLFDSIRKEFTRIENEVDPSKELSVAFRLQEARNAYASKKLEQAEREREAKQRVLMLRQARESFSAACERALRDAGRRMCEGHINRLRSLYGGITLKNAGQVRESINVYKADLSPESLKKSYETAVGLVPSGMLGEDERSRLCSEVFERVHADVLFQISEDVDVERKSLVEMVGSKVAELEKAAAADAAEAERIKAEIARREAEEAAAREAERAAREQAEREREAMKSKSAEMAGLFDQAEASVPAYQAKTTVKKKLVVLDPAGYGEILSMWWVREGQLLGADELGKVLKKQVAFCEKLANDKSDPVEIKSEHLVYEDCVKAR